METIVKRLILLALMLCFAIAALAAELAGIKATPDTSAVNPKPEKTKVSGTDGVGKNKGVRNRFCVFLPSMGSESTFQAKTGDNIR